jgi:hypothetical protein
MHEVGIQDQDGSCRSYRAWILHANCIVFNAFSRNPRLVFGHSNVSE